MEFLHQEGELPRGILLLGFLLGSPFLYPFLRWIRCLSLPIPQPSAETLVDRHPVRLFRNDLFRLPDRGLSGWRTLTGLSHLPFRPAFHPDLGHRLSRRDPLSRRDVGDWPGDGRQLYPFFERLPLKKFTFAISSSNLPAISSGLLCSHFQFDLFRH